MRPQLIIDFENGAIDPSDFHHAKHLEVALWYSLHYSPTEALSRMRDGLRSLLARVGRPEAYSEGTTRYWMEQVQQFLAATDRTQRFERLLAALLTETAAIARQPGG